MHRSIAVHMFAVCLLGTASAWGASADERALASTETRQGLLKVVVSYFGPIVGMAREQIPYDADVVKNNAEKIATLLPMIPDVFRADTRAFDLDTEALDAIWENTADFAEKAAAATQRAEALAAATAAGQGEAMKAFGALCAACKACHDNYRQQD